MAEAESGVTDVRDMYLIHTTLRRELRLGALQVRTVPEGDVERAAVLLEHLRLIDALLYHHHASEDRMVWPLLLERAPAAAEALVPLMEEQHAAIDAALAEVDALMPAFGETADVRAGAALADALDGMVKLLVEHLAVEEERALPLMERHITQEEWTRVVSDGAAEFDQDKAPVLFGMMMYEGDPDTIRDVVDGMPPEFRPVAQFAPGLYADYALRVHGTAAPEKLGAA
jgi:iron-sulfur cluster repair protein YtfE (RIC family)